MNKPYFLTRQTANLMEDFDREIKRGAAMYLLQGEAGVGKSRLLRELVARRMADRSYQFIDLAAAASDTGQDSTAHSSPLAEQIESLFASADPGDVVIADHFEAGSRRCRHQLFQSWATDGIDKQMNLVVAVGNSGVDELKQLARQFEIKIGSFRLAPLSAAEIEAFAGFYLFPQRPIGQLVIPQRLRRQLRRSRGVIGQVCEILDRDGAAIDSESAPDRQRAAGLRLAVVVLVLALGGALGWYFLGQGEVDALTRILNGNQE